MADSETDATKTERKVYAKGITWHKVGYQILKDNMTNVREADLDELEQAAGEWWESDKTRDSFYGKILHQVLDHWAAKTALLVFRIWADRWFFDFLNREEEEEEGEEDD